MLYFVTAIINHECYFVPLACDNDQKKDINPFSYKKFLEDDFASRNKRVLQVVNLKFCYD